MFPVVLSPYEFNARSVCCSAALFVGSPSVTLLPAPLEGTDPGAVGRAMLESPGFSRLIDRWSWSSALWHSGALCGGLGGGAGAAGRGRECPLGHVQRAAAQICGSDEPGGGMEGSDRALSPLAKLVRETRFEETAHYLEALSRDLERGGGDPSVSVPVSVGMESYAKAVGGLMAMGDGRSLVGRLESHRERVVCRLTTTIVHGAGGELMRDLREELGGELDEFRTAVGALAMGGGSSDAALEAGGVLAGAVGAISDDLLGPRREDETRVRGGVRRVRVSVTLAVVPVGDALRAAARAADLLATGHGVRGGVRRAGRRAGGGAERVRSTAGAEGGALAAGTVVRMRVRELPFAA